MARAGKVIRFPVRNRTAGRAPEPASIPLDAATGREVLRHFIDPRIALTGHRARWYASVGLAWLGLRQASRLGWALDEALFPGFRDEPVAAPTFIFANARSGTTLLHRLMSLDAERFVAPKLYENILPAVTWHRLFPGLAKVDERYLNHRLRDAVEWVNRRYLTGWEGIHDIRLQDAEEDEGPWLYTLLTAHTSILFTDLNRFERSLWFDRLEAPTRERYMAYYRQIIQRLLHANGGGRSYLNKNVMFAHRVRSVLEHFPDARFIYLVRHPYDAIGSMVRMWYVAWEAHSPDVPEDAPQVRALVQLCVDYYRYALQCRSFVPPGQFLAVRFDALVADPKATIEGIYRHFGMPVSATYAAKLEEATRSADRFKSAPTHQYSLEQFGVSREEIHAQLRNPFAEVCFAP
jgi:omega-hydroxy-beta-dihydromenaquinone-9 sulfotransferase